MLNLTFIKLELQNIKSNVVRDFKLFFNYLLCLNKFNCSGQAAAYKIGEQRILQLRRKFEAKEGRAYDLVSILFLG
jgi:hypothetical protein